jgi:hypothetical protein
VCQGDGFGYTWIDKTYLKVSEETSAIEEEIKELCQREFGDIGRRSRVETMKYSVLIQYFKEEAKSVCEESGKNIDQRN